MRTEFFLGRVALLEWLERFEAQGRVRYTEFGSTAKVKVTFFSAIALLPNVGDSKSGSPNHDERYLVTPIEQAVNLESIAERSKGQFRYSVTQFLNPDSVIIYLGGIYGERVQVMGFFETASKSVKANELVGRLRRTLKLTVRNVHGYWIDDVSLERARSGWRLTQDVNISPDHDSTNLLGGGV